MALPLCLSRRGLTSSPRLLSLVFPSVSLRHHQVPYTRYHHRCQQLRQQHLPQRLYHSHHHPPPPPHEAQYSNSQLIILSAAIAHIPRHGFSLNALTLGARDAGFLDVSLQLLPRCEFDLVLFWLASRRGLLRVVAEDLNKRVDAEGKRVSSMSVEEKTRELVLGRLRMNADVRRQWQGALALMSLAGNIPFSLSELHALSSDILNLAGDVSVDASWYTERMSVAAIYASAEVFMTRDESPGLIETEAFVNRRFEDSLAIGEKLTGAKQCLGFMGSTAVGLGRSWGLKI